MCTLLTSLASRYGKPGARADRDEDLYVGVQVVSLAARIDGIGPPHCLPTVLAVMPHTTVTMTAIGNARDLCQYSEVAHNPCARITK